MKKLPFVSDGGKHRQRVCTDAVGQRNLQGKHERQVAPLGVAAVIPTFEWFQFGQTVISQQVRQHLRVNVPTRMQSDHPRFASSCKAALEAKVSTYHDFSSWPITGHAKERIARSQLLITCCSRDAARASTCGHVHPVQR